MVNQDKNFYSGMNCILVWDGELYHTQQYTFQFTTNFTPIYGVFSHLWDYLAGGTSIVQGQFIFAYSKQIEDKIRTKIKSDNLRNLKQTNPRWGDRFVLYTKNAERSLVQKNDDQTTVTFDNLVFVGISRVGQPTSEPKVIQVDFIARSFDWFKDKTLTRDVRAFITKKKVVISKSEVTDAEIINPTHLYTPFLSETKNESTGLDISRYKEDQESAFSYGTTYQFDLCLPKFGDTCLSGIQNMFTSIENDRKEGKEYYKIEKYVDIPGTPTNAFVYYSDAIKTLKLEKEQNNEKVTFSPNKQKMIYNSADYRRIMNREITKEGVMKQSFGSKAGSNATLFSHKFTENKNYLLKIDDFYTHTTREPDDIIYDGDTIYLDIKEKRTGQNTLRLAFVDTAEVKANPGEQNIAEKETKYLATLLAKYLSFDLYNHKINLGYIRLGFGIYGRELSLITCMKTYRIPHKIEKKTTTQKGEKVEVTWEKVTSTLDVSDANHPVNIFNKLAPLDTNTSFFNLIKNTNSGPIKKTSKSVLSEDKAAKLWYYEVTLTFILEVDLLCMGNDDRAVFKTTERLFSTFSIIEKNTRMNARMLLIFRNLRSTVQRVAGIEVRTANDSQIIIDPEQLSPGIFEFKDD